MSLMYKMFTMLVGIVNILTSITKYKVNLMESLLILQAFSHKSLLKSTNVSLLAALD